MKAKLIIIFTVLLFGTTVSYASNCDNIKKGEGRMMACKHGHKKGLKACKKVPKGEGRIIACAIGAGKIDCSKPKAKKMACK